MQSTAATVEIALVQEQLSLGPHLPLVCAAGERVEPLSLADPLTAIMHVGLVRYTS